MTTVPRWPVWTLAAGVAAACAALAFALLRYPGVFDDPRARAWTVILAIITAACLAVAVFSLLRPTAAGTVTGTRFGLAAGAAWLGEILAQAPAHLPASLERPAGGFGALVAVGATVAAGVVEGARTRSRARAWWAGLWAGLVSAAIGAVAAGTRRTAAGLPQAQPVANCQAWKPSVVGQTR